MWCGPQCEVGWSQPCIRAPQAGDRDPLVARRGRRPVTGRARTGVPGRVLRRGGRRCMRAGSRRRRRGRPERLQRRRQRRRRRQRAAQPRGRGGARGGARASRLHSALRCSGGCRSRRERVQPGSRPRRRRRLRQRQPQARALARARRAAPAGGALLHDGAGVGRRSARSLPCLAFAAGCGGITGTAEPAARAVGGLGGGRRRHGAGRRRRSGRGQPCRRGRGRSCRRGRWRRARGGPRLRSRAQGLGPRLRLLPPEGFQLRAAPAARSAQRQVNTCAGIRGAGYAAYSTRLSLMTGCQLGAQTRAIKHAGQRGHGVRVLAFRRPASARSRLLCCLALIGALRAPPRTYPQALGPAACSQYVLSKGQEPHTRMISSAIAVSFYS